MISDHMYDAGWPRDDTKGCVVYVVPMTGRVATEEENAARAVERPCGRPESEHEHTEYPFYGKDLRGARDDGPVVHQSVADAAEMHGAMRLRLVSPEAAVLEAAENGDGNQLEDFTTKELLEELRVRGDLAMVMWPCTERGADGAALSALASTLLRSSTGETLEATRVQ